MKQKTKLIIILTVEFIALAAMLLMIFFAGKKSYTVTFDLNGGTLLGGDTVQTVTQGHDATPPSVTKDGHYLLRWSGSYKEVTRDIVVKAIWEYETSYGIEYSVPSNGTYCEISGCYERIGGELYIGAYYNNKKVLGIKEGAFENCNRITAIHLLDGILDIKARAFANCTSLKTIEIPSTTLMLGDEAFLGCESLEQIALPEGLEEIGDGAFLGCESLTEIVIPSTVVRIGDNAFAGCEKLTKITFAESEPDISGEEVAKAEADIENEDGGGGSEEETEAPAATITIGSGAFYGCTSLETVELPKNLISVGDEAFAGCESLSSIALPEGLLEIGNGAFALCSLLTEIILPASVEIIGEYAFSVEGLTVYTYAKEAEAPEGWHTEWHSDAVTVEWEYSAETATENEPENTEDGGSAE